MALWSSANLQDKGIDYLRTATFLDLVKNYTPGDSLATVAANTIAETALTTGDFALSTPSAGIRRVTSAQKTGVVASGTVPAATPGTNSFVFRTASEVLYAAGEKTGMAVTAGNQLTFPALYLETPQPTVVA